MVTEADELITVRQAAQEYRRTAETVRRWVWEGKVPAQKLGNQLFLKRSDLDSLMDSSHEAVRESRLAALARIDAVHERMRARGAGPFDTLRDLDEARASRDR